MKKIKGTSKDFPFYIILFIYLEVLYMDISFLLMGFVLKGLIVPCGEHRCVVHDLVIPRL